MSDTNTNRILIDIGSTILKIAKQGQSNVERFFLTRDMSRPVGDQVLDVIKQLKNENSNAIFRICSSANGGLRVGIISLTTRYSGEVAKRIALSSGCNLVWSHSDKNEKLPSDKVDVIVISGGLTVNDSPFQKNWLCSIIQKLEYDVPVLYCGNAVHAPVLLASRPDAVILDNIIHDDMRINAAELSNTLKELYMQDLVQKDGVSMLQPFSEIPIWPTPAICEKSFRSIIENRTGFHLSPPLLMMDLGGATTDVYYGRELIEDFNELNVEALPVNRFVFSSIGVQSSRASALLKLNSYNRLYDLLKCFSNEDVQKRYAALKDNDLSWIGDQEMFYLCFGLVLEGLQEGNESGHPIALNMVSTLIITGGASKVCDPTILEKIYSLYTIKGGYPTPDIFVDEQYEIWTLGISTI